jgi:hypothetical protein
MRKSVSIRPIGKAVIQQRERLSGITGRLDAGDPMQLQQFTEQIACKLVVFDNQYTLHRLPEQALASPHSRPPARRHSRMSCSVIRFSNGVVESNIPPVQSVIPKLYAQCALAKLHFQVRLQHNKKTCFR